MIIVLGDATACREKHVGASVYFVVPTYGQYRSADTTVSAAQVRAAAAAGTSIRIVRVTVLFPGEAT